MSLNGLQSVSSADRGSMKAMMYKTLSTVVDDFFAFCVRMPWLHRLACFRDDVVFLILLYQVRGHTASIPLV